MKLIEQRMAELKEQYPVLGKLEKAIAREGMEKVMSKGTISEIVSKLEQGEIRTSMSTEEFIQLGANAKGMKSVDANSSNSFTEDGVLPTGAEGKSAQLGQNSNGSAFDQGDGGASDFFASKTPEVPTANTESTADGFTNISRMADSKALAPTIDLGQITTRSVRTAFMPEAVRAVELLSTEGGGEMKIALNPKNLGSIELQVKSNANQVQVQMIVENPELADAIKKNTEQLVESLKDQKIQVSTLDVTVKSSAGSNNSGFANENSSDSMNDSQQWDEQRNNFAGDLDSEQRDFGSELADEMDMGDNISGPLANDSSPEPKANVSDPNRLVDIEA